MPNRTELRKMTKAQLVDFSCTFFADEGNLRQELDDMNLPDLLALLFEHEADADEEKESVPMSSKKSPVSPLDLGNW